MASQDGGLEVRFRGKKWVCEFWSTLEMDVPGFWGLPYEYCAQYRVLVINGP